MPDYLIKEETLTNIANAIRSKTGTTEQINPDDMDDKIENISTSATIYMGPIVNTGGKGQLVLNNQLVGKKIGVMLYVSGIMQAMSKNNDHTIYCSIFSGNNKVNYKKVTSTITDWFGYSSNYYFQTFQFYVKQGSSNNLYNIYGVDNTLLLSDVSYLTFWEFGGTTSNNGSVRIAHNCSYYYTIDGYTLNNESTCTTPFIM